MARLRDASSANATLQSERVPEVTAASAILRMDGRVVGFGAAWRDAANPTSTARTANPANPTNPANTANTARSAVERAIDQAIQAAQADEVARAWMQAGHPLHEGVTLEMEIAGEPTPLGGRTIADAAATIGPAFDAIAVRRGAATEWISASRLQSMGLAANPADGIAMLMRRLGLADADLPTLDPAEQVSLYRLPSARLAQRAPGATPWPGMHGERLAALHDVDDASLVASMRSAAAWLDASMVEDPERHELVLLGDYATIADRRQPMTASDSERALSAWALAEAASIAPEQERAHWLSRASAIVRAAAPAADAPSDIDERRARALRVIAWCAIESATPATDRTAIAADVARAIESFGSSVHEEASADPARALELAAAASALRAGHAVLTQAALHGAIARAWEELPKPSLGGEAEWLLRAASWSKLPAPPAPALQDAVRDLLMRSQLGIGSASRELPADLVGAIEVTTSRGSHQAGAQGIRFFAALALMAASPTLDAEARARLTASCRAGARFIQQLQVSADGAALMRNPRRSLGGVREAPWEPRIRVAGTAAAVLALAELRAALAAEASVDSQ